MEWPVPPVPQSRIDAVHWLPHCVSSPKEPMVTLTGEAYGLPLFCCDTRIW